MEKHISKKFLAGILALSAGCVLAACDPVSAVPQNYNDPIIASTDGEIKLDGNNLGTLYDSITSERNSKIVEKILSQIAEKKFGSYADFLKACSNTEEQTKFVNAHSDFFGTDENKDARFTDFKNDLNERISEYFYNEITSGSYNDDLGRFSEKKLYNAHKYELYDLAEVAETSFKTFFVDKELTKENAFSKLNGAAYQVAEEGKRGYIQEKVYPDILRNKLVEDYIYKNNPSSLGRAYARKLSYVKISYEGESKFADSLMEKFATTYIEAAGNLDFSIIENAYKGFRPYTGDGTDLIAPLNASETALYEATAETIEVLAADVATQYTHMGIVIVPAGEYYKDSKIGKILEDYAKAIKGEEQGRFPTEENKTALDSFTSDGKSKQYGLLQKVTALMKEDYTTDGWFVKNGGVTELPSAIRDRLFNIRVANSLDDDSLVNEDSAEKMGAYEYVDGDKTKDKLTRLPYLRNIYGKKVVLPSKSLSFDKDPYNYIYHDVDGKAFYVCEVLEAPSTAKLNEASTVYTALEKEEISRQVAKILGTKDSYIKDAYTEYLNKYVFVFFDTSLYDYFKSEYPDLDQFQD
ncbi:MAG: hypothetical protein IKP50_05690 [Bacilli bacterium]|nr:hypothetical protein [Bacilli bacterium]